MTMDVPAAIGELWSKTQGEPSICVAVLDGPIDVTHPCFEGANLTVNGDIAPNSAVDNVRAHGTHVASIIFGQPTGVFCGLAPRCRGLIVPIFADTPEGGITSCSDLDLARALIRSVQLGAHVINISGGRLSTSSVASRFLTNAIAYCEERKVLIVAAAGNDGCDCLHIPAAFESVLAVGAADSSGSPTPFSNWGKSYASHGLLAPGENILGAAPGGGFSRRSGTSSASPIVAGIAALLLSLQAQRGTEIDALAIRRALLLGSDACDVVERQHCQRYLRGSLNVAGSLRMLSAEAPNLESAVAPRLHALTGFNSGRMKMTGVAVGVEPSSICVDSDATTSSIDGSQSDQTAAELNPPDSTVHSKGGAAYGHSTRSDQSLKSQPTALSMLPSACCANCTNHDAPQLVYALGYIGYGFGSEARQDAIRLDMATVANPQGGNPYDPDQLLALLERSPDRAASIIWTLNIDATPIYAVLPFGAFAADTFKDLGQFLKAQMAGRAERVSVPGVISGKVRLMNGTVLPAITPDRRGLYCWSIAAMVEQLYGVRPKKADDVKRYEEEIEDFQNFLRRIYDEVRNLGMTAEERAINYAATNAFQIQQILKKERSNKMHIDHFDVAKSPVCRPDSDCWDVKLYFFDPENRTGRARRVWLITIDVSDVVPVMVGQPRRWSIY